jgi:ATP-dependent Clp protease adaptor protein ClpS
MPTAPSSTKKTKPRSTSHSGSGDGCKTILFNCNCHTFDSVIEQLMYAIGCTYAAGKRYAHIIHTTGQATVFTGTQEECDDVADKLAEIGLKVRVTS